MPDALPSVAAAEQPRWRLMLRAFRSRNYRLFFGGQFVSLVGTFLTQVATGWLVYRLAKEGAHPGNPAMWLGVVGFAGQIPLMLLTPLTGVWVDRWNRRRLLVVTQTLAMIQSLALAFLALTHRIDIPHVIVLALFQGLINAFDIPCRQAFLIEIVGNREDLPNAIALNSTMVHGARLIGPAMAGLLIGFFGEGACFLIDGLSYIGVIAALVAMRVAPRPARTRNSSVLQELREGFDYVWGSAPIRSLLVLMALLSLTAFPAISTLMPIVADAMNSGHAIVATTRAGLPTIEGASNAGARTMGFLMAMSGFGALLGAIYLASRRSVVGLGKVIAIAATIFGLVLIAFSSTHSFWVCMMIVPFAGYATIATFASANTVLQTLSDEDKRGRVMSFFTMAFIGMTPFGNLLIGLFAGQVAAGAAAVNATNTIAADAGARRAILVAGLVCLGAAAMFWAQLPGLRKLVRPIYIAKGILPPDPPELAAGINEEMKAEPSHPSHARRAAGASAKRKS